MRHNKKTYFCRPVEYTITNNRSDKAYTVKLNDLFEHIDKQLTMEVLGSQQKMRKTFRRWLKHNGKLTDKFQARNLFWQYEINDFDGDYEGLKHNLKHNIQMKARVESEQRANTRMMKHLRHPVEKDKHSGQVGLEVKWGNEFVISTPRGLTYSEKVELARRIQNALDGFVLPERYTRAKKWGGYTYSYEDSVANRWYNKAFKKEDR